MRRCAVVILGLFAAGMIALVLFLVWKVKSIPRHPKKYAAFAVSPQGRDVVAAIVTPDVAEPSTHRLVVISLRDRLPALVMPGGGRVRSAVSWSGDGRFVAFALWNGIPSRFEFRMVRVSDGATWTSEGIGAPDKANPCPNVNGTSVYYRHLAETNEIWRLDWASRRTSRVTASAARPFLADRILDDGRIVAWRAPPPGTTRQADRELCVVSPSGSVKGYDVWSRTKYAVCIAPDGRHVAALCWPEHLPSGDVLEVWVVDVAGGEPARLVSTGRYASHTLSWGPDGETLLVGDDISPGYPPLLRLNIQTGLIDAIVADTGEPVVGDCAQWAASPPGIVFADARGLCFFDDRDRHVRVLCDYYGSVPPAEGDP